MIVAGRHQFFPKRELETIEYSIEETYQGLYKELRGYLGKGRKKMTASRPDPNCRRTDLRPIWTLPLR